MDATITLAHMSDAAAAPLVDGLMAHYRRNYGASLDGEFAAYDDAEFAPPRGALVLLVAGEETIAGGALRTFAAGVGEIKRMWTAPAHRRRGHAVTVLAELERIAADRGLHTLRLETADLETGAIRLYRAHGYVQIPPYGRMAHHPRCVCFEKRL
jgi:ribosomal protein S18 acetylase RimI-like enzyme